MTPRSHYLAFIALICSLLSPTTFSFAPVSHQHAAAARIHHPTRHTATAEETSSIAEEPARNPDRPELPAVPNDYDWDAKHGNDPDWIRSGPSVPGQRVLSDIEIAQQATALGGLEDKWRQERLQQEYEASAKTGFVPLAEVINGRTAMFFLVTGLLTEYWTGISLPGQVEEMLRIAGVIGFD